jgi:adenine/guanine phosphoribosyltransferase-like PRPP-binding protein
MKGIWSGEWVADRLGVRVTNGPVPSGRTGLALAELLGLALRRNPKRAHLLVSTVLGKHIPTDPRIVYGAGRLLGALVADALDHADGGLDSADEGIAALGGRALSRALDGDPQAATELLALCEVHLSARSGRSAQAGLPSEQVALVIGFAETATGLGHAVADAMRADYLHSTRRRVSGLAPTASFEEGHSHATSHRLLPARPELLTDCGAPLILVDDELSTGQTVMNTIRALHSLRPRERYLIATLVDVRSADDRRRMAAEAEELGAAVEVVCLARGTVATPAGVLERGLALVAEHAAPAITEPSDPMVAAAPAAPLWTSETSWPRTVQEGGRHGFAPGSRSALERAAADCATRLLSELGGSASPPGRILVLGVEELMYAPLRIAVELAERVSAGVTVLFSSTSRSPVLAIDDPRYAVRSQLSFPAADRPADGPGLRYAYNVAADAGRSFDDIVLVTDSATAPELAADLSRAAARIHLVQIRPYQPVDSSKPPLPAPLTGPGFGSYPAAEVSWLLTDLSQLELEAPVEEREEAVQSGGAHYAESLPIEFQPSAEYQTLYTEALRRSAERVAVAVGVVAELVLAERGPNAVLVSLARAGTPVGALLRRWANWRHGLDLPHYSVSIVRGRGIDTVALRYLAAHHDPRSVMFIDGWTGKGAITAELAAAVAGANRDFGLAGEDGFSAELAVLADTGDCVRLFGTREDFLIPSACLNSTVSGLVSRTVLNEQHLAAGDFHGAKFYRDLAEVDVSIPFLDAIADRFAAILPKVTKQLVERRADSADGAPRWRGR